VRRTCNTGVFVYIGRCSHTQCYSEVGNVTAWAWS